MKRKHLLLELSGADWVTALATALIVIATWLLVAEHYEPAIAVGFVSMYLDYVDGAVARRYGGSPYGHVLDSLYDVLGWVLFPSLAINVATNWSAWAVVVTTVYCVACVLRLGRFTVEGYVESESRYYVGLPVLFSQYALVVVPVFAGTISVIGLAVMVPLMLSSRLIKKPHPATAYGPLLFAALFLYLSMAHD